mgnify:CR=1 FL=1
MFCAATDGIMPELSVPGSNLIFNSGTLPGTYFYWGMVRTGGLALRWFKDSIARQEGDDYYGTLDELAKRHKPGCEGAMFLLTLPAATALSNVRGTFTGLPSTPTKGPCGAASSKASATTTWKSPTSDRAAGIGLKHLTITEGGSRDELWNQIKADMLDTTVVTLKVAGGAVPTNCIVAAYAAGDIKDLKKASNASWKLKPLMFPMKKIPRCTALTYEKRGALLKASMGENKTDQVPYRFAGCGTFFIGVLGKTPAGLTDNSHWLWIPIHFVKNRRNFYNISS